MRTVAILKAASAAVTFLLVTPSILLLFYLALDHMKATSLMWFLFWIYVPARLICGALNVIFASLMTEGPRDWHERWRDE